MAAIVEGVFDPALIERIKQRLRHPPDRAVVNPPGTPVPEQVPATCWTLDRIRRTFDEVRDWTLSGIWRLLRRLRIRLRQGRPQLFSPDPDYLEKEAALLAVLRHVAGSAARDEVLFLDEFTAHHWPLVARTWSCLDEPPPRADRAEPGERRSRIIGALNGRTGRVHYRQRSRISRDVCIAFLEDLAAAYPDAERIYVVMDNWPVHTSPLVAAAVAELPRLQLVFLPTYAPWLNPIEKLWDWLKDAVLRLHRRAGEWKALRTEVNGFLDTFATASPALLHRVGLTGTGSLASALHPVLVTDHDRQN